MPVSNRVKFFDRNNGSGPETKTYEITDPHFRPDLRGQFSGGFVPRRYGDAWLVDMTEAQAKFHLLNQTVREWQEPATAPAVKSEPKTGVKD